MARVKTTGAEFKKFYCQDPTVWDENPGDKGWYVEDMFLVIDGANDQTMDNLYDRFGDDLDRIPDEAVVEIDSGYFGWQGNGERPATREEDLLTYFKQWQKRQTTHTIVATIELDLDDTKSIARVENALARLGARFERITPVGPAGEAMSAEDKLAQIEALVKARRDAGSSDTESEAYTNGRFDAYADVDRILNPKPSTPRPR